VIVEGLQKIKSGAAVVAKPWTPASEKTADSSAEQPVAKTESKPENK